MPGGNGNYGATQRVERGVGSRQVTFEVVL
jgi:hypothetical protein